MPPTLWGLTIFHWNQPFSLRENSHLPTSRGMNQNNPSTPVHRWTRHLKNHILFVDANLPENPWDVKSYAHSSLTRQFLPSTACSTLHNKNSSRTPFPCSTYSRLAAHHHEVICKPWHHRSFLAKKPNCLDYEDFASQPFDQGNATKSLIYLGEKPTGHVQLWLLGNDTGRFCFMAIMVEGRCVYYLVGGENVHGTASRFCSHEHAPLKIPRNHHLETRAHQKQDHCRKLAGWTGHFCLTWVLFQQSGKTSRTPTHWDRPWVPWNPRRRLCTAKERQMDRREVSKEIFS